MVPSGLDARIERLQPAARRQRERILIVRQLDWTSVMHDREWSRATTLGGIIVPETRVQEQRARMRLVGAWPLNAVERIESRVAHAGKLRRERTHFVPHVFRARRAPIAAHAL